MRGPLLHRLGEMLAAIVEAGPPHDIFQCRAGGLANRSDVLEHVTHLRLARQAVIGKVRITRAFRDQRAVLVTRQLLAEEKQIANLYRLRLVTKRLRRLAGLDGLDLERRVLGKKSEGDL